MFCINTNVNITIWIFNFRLFDQIALLCLVALAAAFEEPADWRRTRLARHSSLADVDLDTAAHETGTFHGEHGPNGEHIGTKDVGTVDAGHGTPGHVHATIGDVGHGTPGHVHATGDAGHGTAGHVHTAAVKV